MTAAPGADRAIASGVRLQLDGERGTVIGAGPEKGTFRIWLSDTEIVRTYVASELRGMVMVIPDLDRRTALKRIPLDHPKLKDTDDTNAVNSALAELAAVRRARPAKSPSPADTKEVLVAQDSDPVPPVLLVQRSTCQAQPEALAPVPAPAEAQPLPSPAPAGGLVLPDAGQMVVENLRVDLEEMRAQCDQLRAQCDRQHKIIDDQRTEMTQWRLRTQAELSRQAECVAEAEAKAAEVQARADQVEARAAQADQFQAVLSDVREVLKLKADEELVPHLKSLKRRLNDEGHKAQKWDQAQSEAARHKAALSAATQKLDVAASERDAAVSQLRRRSKERDEALAQLQQEQGKSQALAKKRDEWEGHAHEAATWAYRMQDRAEAAEMGLSIVAEALGLQAAEDLVRSVGRAAIELKLDRLMLDRVLEDYQANTEDLRIVNLELDLANQLPAAVGSEAVRMAAKLQEEIQEEMAKQDDRLAELEQLAETLPAERAADRRLIAEILNFHWTCRCGRRCGRRSKWIP